MIAFLLATSVAITVTLTPLSSGTRVRLQAVSAAGNDIVWASGLDGTFVRSLDGGKTWRAHVVEGAAELQFRDVHAVDADTAYLLSAGPGKASRIYETADGGRSWSLQFVNDDPDAFFDCMDFWDESHGLAYSDSLDEAMVVARTSDGEHWARIPADALPPPLPGEGGFAASGTCVTTLGESTAFVAMGAGSSRVLRTLDGGETWDVFETPVPARNETSGLTSVVFRSADDGAAAGGDIGAPDTYADNIALTEDGGESWWLVAGPTFPGAVYAIAYIPGAPVATLVAVGPGGASYSTDDGGSWASIADDSYWSLAFTPSGIGFLVGPDGRLARLDFDF